MSELALKLIQENRQHYKKGDISYKKLDLGRCGLSKIPEEIFENIWLEELILCNEWLNYKKKIWINSKNKGHKNNLSLLPYGLVNMRNLRILRCNGDYNDNWQISKLENLPLTLNHLDISSNQIQKLENLPQSLNQLDISDNKIQKLENLPLTLTELKIYSNQIRKLENLPQNLTKLKIYSNQIQKLENLPLTLNQLDISYNKIQKLENLPQSLNQLDISDNQIQKLENLPLNLNELDISSNQIQKLENLPLSLNQFDIRDNKISNITPLKDLIIIKGLNISWERKTSGIILENNPLTTPPPEIVKKGREAVLRYFEDIEETGVDFLYEAKLLIVGEPGAGKTSLYRKLV